MPLKDEKLRKSLINVATLNDEQDDEIFVTPGDSLEGGAIVKGNVAIPKVTAEDVRFSASVAKIMEGYKPPAATPVQSPPTASPPPLFLAPAVVPTTRPISPAVADPLPPSLPSPLCSEATVAVAEDQPLSSSEHIEGPDKRGKEQESGLGASDDLKVPEGSPSFWSYRAIGVSFGTSSASPPKAPTAAVGKAGTTSLDAAHPLSSWLLSDGPPNFSSSGNLKRKREMDEEAVLRCSLQRVQQVAGVVGGEQSTLRDIEQLLHAEKLHSEKLEQAVSAAFSSESS